MEYCKSAAANKQYFDYLWFYFSPVSSSDHSLSLISIINENIRSGITSSFAVITDTHNEEKFAQFMNKVISISASTATLAKKTSCIIFLINIFKNLEVDVVRNYILKFFSVPLWHSLTQERLNAELRRASPQLQAYWEHAVSSKQTAEAAAAGHVTEEVESTSGKETSGKKRKSIVKSKENNKTNKCATSSAAAVAPSAVLSSSSAAGAAQIDTTTEATWFPFLLSEYIHTIEEGEPQSSSVAGGGGSDVLRYVERFSELLIDLLSQLTTRRFLLTLVDDMHIVVRCRRSTLFASPHSKLFSQLVQMLEELSKFEIDDFSGKELSPQEILSTYHARLHHLQQLAYSNYKEELSDLIFSSTGEVGKVCLLFCVQLHTFVCDCYSVLIFVLQTTNLRKYFSLLSDSQLFDLGVLMGSFSRDSRKATRDLVVDVLVDKLSYRASQLEFLNRMSLYPSEKMLWDPSLVPLGAKYDGNQTFAMPKLNLQYLTMHDCFLRNFTLYRLESAYEIRQDLTDVVKRMAPRQSMAGAVNFGGWARMALPLLSLFIQEVMSVCCVNVFEKVL